MLKNIAFLDVYAKFSLKGVRMQRLKKAFLFILGFMVVPRFLSAVIMQALNREELDLLSGFFAIIYLLIYFSFPVLYRGKIREKIPNRYLFYVLLYLPFAALFVLIYL